MCGIVGYIGKKNSVPILLDGLKSLEYRGYDSAGIAIVENNNIIIEYKISTDEESLKIILEEKGDLNE